MCLTVDILGFKCSIYLDFLVLGGINTGHGRDPYSIIKNINKEHNNVSLQEFQAKKSIIPLIWLSQ